MQEILKELEEHAEHLNSIDMPVEGCRVFYEIMSGALVWDDETNDETPRELMAGALRFLAAYRTSLILGKPNDDYKLIWDRAVELFPHWIGFLPERCTATSELLEIYRRGNVSLRKCLRDLEREAETE